jgi:hypothetical protein
MVIFNSYVKLPEGISYNPYKQKQSSHVVISMTDISVVGDDQLIFIPRCRSGDQRAG